jgi:hypothetical protein
MSLLNKLKCAVGIHCWGILDSRKRSPRSLHHKVCVRCGLEVNEIQREDDWVEERQARRRSSREEARERSTLASKILAGKSKPLNEER